MALPVGGLPRFLVTGVFIVTVFIVTLGIFFVTGFIVTGFVETTGAAFSAFALPRCWLRSSAMASAIAGHGWRDQCLVPQTMHFRASMLAVVYHDRAIPIMALMIIILLNDSSHNRL